MLKFEHDYSKLPEQFYKFTRSDIAPAPKLLAFNWELSKKLLNLKLEKKHTEKLLDILAGKTPIESSISQAYAGHQFGHFNPSLGDGRAMLLGEIKTSSGKLYDVQLKGSCLLYTSPSPRD